MHRTRAAAVAAVVSLATACSGASSVSIASRSGTPATPTPTPSRSPAASGPVRIPSVRKALPVIERFVEHERGLKFKRPVKAKLLGRKAFLAELNKGDHPPSQHAIDKMISDFSSVGLISPRINIVKAVRTASNADTLGFYSPKTKRLYVRGTRATPGVRAVLSHELTHALTDQWFGLRRPKLEHSHQELGSGWDALTEGDAERTRKAYERTQLTPAEKKLANHEENGGPTPHVPLVILELMGFPYAIGPQFVDAIVEDGGIKALNAAYRHPPRSTEQLFDPTAYFNHDEPKHVATPPADGTVVDHGDLGMIGLLLTFEHGLTKSQAFGGVSGWGGDQYVTWNAGPNRWCMRDSVVMDYGLATDAFQGTLEKWVKTRHGAAHIEHIGHKTTFVSCSS